MRVPRARAPGLQANERTQLARLCRPPVPCIEHRDRCGGAVHPRPLALRDEPVVQAHERGRRVGALDPRRHALRGHHIQIGRRDVVAELPALDELVQDRTDREDVDRWPTAAGRVLRRHVARLALDVLTRRVIVVVLADSEVDDLDLARRAQDDVARRQIAMRDALRDPVDDEVGVRVVQALEDAAQDVRDERERQHLTARTQLLEELPQILAIDQLELDVHDAAELAGVHDRHDVRVAHASGDPHLVEDPAAPLRVEADEVGEDLERDRLVDGAHRLAREPHLRHATGADRLHQHVLAEGEWRLGGLRVGHHEAPPGSVATATRSMARREDSIEADLAEPGLCHGGGVACVEPHMGLALGCRPSCATVARRSIGRRLALGPDRDLPVHSPARSRSASTRVPAAYQRLGTRAIVVASRPRDALQHVAAIRSAPDAAFRPAVPAAGVRVPGPAHPR